ncbi:MAG: beta-ketoacyl-[acyl-carrier-protein] synthase family protein [Elusimicrobia bacterium]|nr:beta-ketoacyl-[acyl-carrier-protein] synthase family protein [Elusimicrobiota bacterium]
MMKRVVVTGMGVVAANGVGLAAFRSALKAGRSGIKRHEHLQKLNFSCQIGGIPDLTEEDILKVLPEPESRKLGEAQVYTALAAVECARSAGIHADLYNGFKDSAVDWNTGVIMGCGIGGMDTIFEEMGPAMASAEEAEPGRGPAAMGTDVVPKIMGSSTSVVIGRFLGLGNLTSSNSSACNTGTEAVFAGWNHLQMGYADAMYVGGAEGSHYGIWAGFDAMRDVLCSKFNETPERGSQPMGALACGFVPGSGAAVLRIETLEAAQKRGAPILAELLAAYCNSGGQRDGGSMTFPNPEGVTRCIRRVLKDAAVEPSAISLINGHLTSTGADPQEVSSWMSALELAPEKFPLIQSTKSMIGHGLGAAGALESVAVVDQLGQGYVHPSINCEETHPRIKAIERSIPRSCMQKRLDLAIKASFGFGDVNGCLLYKRWDGR